MNPQITRNLIKPIHHNILHVSEHHHFEHSHLYQQMSGEIRKSRSARFVLWVLISEQTGATLTDTSPIDHQLDSFQIGGTPKIDFLIVTKGWF